MQPSATFATANATVSDNLLRNGVIPLNRDATTSKSRVSPARDRIMNCYNAVRDLWILFFEIVIYFFDFSRHC